VDHLVLDFGVVSCFEMAVTVEIANMKMHNQDSFLEDDVLYTASTELESCPSDEPQVLRVS